MKYCRDCKHKRWDMLGSNYYRCVAPQNGQREDPVTGKVILLKGYCEINRREFSGLCGPKGVWFEPKKGSVK